jgi:hypothetical protein
MLAGLLQNSSRSDGRRRSFGSGGQGDDGGFDGARSSTSTTATSYEKEKRAKPDLVRSNLCVCARAPACRWSCVALLI